MKNYACISLLTLALLAGGGSAPSTSLAALNSPIITPTPKWQGKACFASWCETGWYASPAVADLNGDGKPEVIWSPYSIYVVDGATGNPIWNVRFGHDRSSTSIPPTMSVAPGPVLSSPISTAMAQLRL